MSTGSRKAKAGNEIEAMLEELLARNGALEAMQAQVVLLLAGLTDDPDTSIRLTMADVVTNLRRSQARAVAAGGTTEARIVGRAIGYAQQLTERMLAARRHAGPQESQ